MTENSQWLKYISIYIALLFLLTKTIKKFS